MYKNKILSTGFNFKRHLDKVLLFLADHKYSFLFGSYIISIVLATFRAVRQPNVPCITLDQIKIAFKATTLAFLITGMANNGRINLTKVNQD